MAYSLGTFLANIAYWFKTRTCRRYGHGDPVGEFYRMRDSAFPGDKSFDVVMTCRRCGAVL